MTHIPTKQEYETCRAWGLLVSIDLHDCNPKTIRSASDIESFIIQLCDLIDMQRWGPCNIVRFGNGDLEGYSVAQFIETSLVSGHFDEKNEHAYLDIFSCKYFDPITAAGFARDFFMATDTTITCLLRK